MNHRVGILCDFMKYMHESEKEVMIADSLET